MRNSTLLYRGVLLWIAYGSKSKLESIRQSSTNIFSFRFLSCIFLLSYFKALLSIAIIPPTFRVNAIGTEINQYAKWTVSQS